MVYASLQHAAAVAVRSDNDAVRSDSVKDELRIFRGQTVQTLLNDMIAIQILYKLNNLISECMYDCFNLHKQLSTSQVEK